MLSWNHWAGLVVDLCLWVYSFVPNWRRVSLGLVFHVLMARPFLRVDGSLEWCTSLLGQGTSICDTSNWWFLFCISHICSHWISHIFCAKCRKCYLTMTRLQRGCSYRCCVITLFVDFVYQMTFQLYRYISLVTIYVGLYFLIYCCLLCSYWQEQLQTKVYTKNNLCWYSKTSI